MPKFVFYALGYALERALSMSRSGISGFLPSIVKSQQLNLFKYFKIAWVFLTVIFVLPYASSAK